MTFTEWAAHLNGREYPLAIGKSEESAAKSDGVVIVFGASDDLCEFRGCVDDESGYNARPMHPQWARDIRDQCQAAGVPFFFKQWGEWGPLSAAQHTKEYAGGIRTEDWREVRKHRLMDFPENDQTEPLPLSAIPAMGREYIKRVGKKSAGRLLDGVEHSEFSTATPSIA